MNLFQEIKERRVLPAVGVYIGASWVLVEIIDRLAERYYLSPYITDAVFWGLYSLVPAVILIAWTHGRPGKDRATRAEKVGVPINVIATIGLLVTVFGNKDMSATADLVTLSNELGQQEAYYVPREGYRSHLAVFFFDNPAGDDELEWLQYGITELLTQDLQQNPFMQVTSPWQNPGFGLYSHMQKAGFESGLGLPVALKSEIARDSNKPFFVDGSLREVEDLYELEVNVWDSGDTSKLGSEVFSGWNLMGVVDEASIWVRETLEVPAARRGFAGDMPLAETYGESEQALKDYIAALNAIMIDNDWVRSNEYFDRALEVDPDLVMAWFMKGLNLWEQADVEGARAAINRARELDYRLPDRDKVLLKSIEYRMTGEQDKLEKLLRMQTQVQDNADAYQQLAQFLMLAGRLEESRDNFQKVLSKDRSSPDPFIKLAQIERALGNTAQAVEYANEYVAARPNDWKSHVLQGNLLVDSGELDTARASYLKAGLLEDPPVASNLKLAQLAIRQGTWSEARQYIDEARTLAATDHDAINIFEVEQLLEVRLGRIARAIELSQDQDIFNEQVLTPLDRLFRQKVPLIQYNLMLGNLDEAEAALQETNEQLQAPLNQFMAFMEAVLESERGNFEAAERAVQRGADVIEEFKADYMAFQVPLAQAEIESSREKLLGSCRSLYRGRAIGA